ncbi:RNA-binding transcriptional accessory protein [Heliorestis acidaminivorans]|uniref:RNA-binding transcriptional accessory protein n=1 Tax=Heliorestis acidaminivorans TaxID=553427 RepID=A0A6I0F281_9FIRM|nr:Tex family protein [Heliorestis acidaminivorans]KAB2954151.1 RNA-binding transcriptional accessory protein [Heliorestis acidaminivorans]
MTPTKPWEEPIVPRLARELNIAESRIQGAVELYDEGNTIPFIARYRKERTGEMNEVELRQLVERLEYLRSLDKRKTEVYRLVKEMDKITEPWLTSLQKAQSLAEVEDLYLPFRPKRKTRASVAREKGLAPLAEALMKPPYNEDPVQIAKAYINPEKEIKDEQMALAGAIDIIAEEISEDAKSRQWVRHSLRREAYLVVTATKLKESGPYETYYDFREKIKTIPAHRILAINRGEREKALSVKIEGPDTAIQEGLYRKWIQQEETAKAIYIIKAINDSYKRLIRPSIERELRAELTEKAEEQAITVFATNLSPLLLQRPVRRKIIMGLDPGYRTGCKLAVINDTGKVLTTKTIFPHKPQSRWQEAITTLKELIDQYEIQIIAIGNGTASRESEQLIAQVIQERNQTLQYTIVSEAGASVYSASPLATEEFPELDVAMRSAISIARRLQDPLAELVKIEPSAIGVGQYQHDVNNKRLHQTLSGVVEDCVNAVGVDINTASPSLLSYVAGIKPAIAKTIVSYREENGPFRKRKDLLKVPRLGAATFTQCAGFVRIPDGDDPIENTPIHPESYDRAQALVALLGEEQWSLKKEAGLEKLRQKLSSLELEKTAQQLQIGLPTLRDLIEALSKPGRDPREDLPKPSFRTDVMEMKDLRPGMVLEGKVSNVVDFGAFVDIGVKQDGLVHISALTNRFIKHPFEVVSVGDQVTVRVLDIDLSRGRISLTMRLEDS